MQELYFNRNYKIDFEAMYRTFDLKYNSCTLLMSRDGVFLRALNDGLIDEETYQAARKYYGALWFSPNNTRRMRNDRSRKSK